MNMIEKVLSGWLLTMLVFALVAHFTIGPRKYSGWCTDAIFKHENTKQAVHSYYKDKTEALADLGEVGRPDLENLSFRPCDN